MADHLRTHLCFPILLQYPNVQCMHIIYQCLLYNSKQNNSQQNRNLLLITFCLPGTKGHCALYHGPQLTVNENKGHSLELAVHLFIMRACSILQFKNKTEH